MGRTCKALGKDKKCLLGFADFERKIPFGRSKCRCEDTVTRGPGEITWNCLNWIHATQDTDRWRAFVNKAVTLGVT